MKHGYGDQKFIRKSYLEDRRRALKDKRDFTSEELDRRDLDVNQPGEGGGRTNPETYELWQHPWPLDQSVRKRKKYDIRTNPKVGD